ncbi:PREDICTED: uncharacterized protein LOC109461755 [Branchiostoma belcheri]|uniref:Uncharacterized protein LOC109461755 n=1 Tax=Branchiostoma belcheri TaxID=7741 RepID=A0A6P4YA99_BRABE|nr:PREDICTED: uncharacterized protein LOC109461755 [Branchiostoma belcheri]
MNAGSTRRGRVSKREVYLLEPGTTSIPRGDARAALWANGHAQEVEITRTDNSAQLLDTIHNKYASARIDLRSMPWQYMSIVGHNTLVPYLNTVNGTRLLNTLCKRQSRCFYIRKREASDDDEEPGPQEPADLPGQGPDINNQNGNDIVIIDDEPALLDAQDVADESPNESPETIEGSVFEDAVEFGTLDSLTPPLDMLEGFAGPHTAALLTAAAGVKRPWPVPLSLAAARDICRRQQRPLVIIFGMTDTAAGTRLVQIITSPRENYTIVRTISVSSCFSRSAGQICLGFGVRIAADDAPEGGQ